MGPLYGNTTAYLAAHLRTVIQEHGVDPWLPFGALYGFLSSGGRYHDRVVWDIVVRRKPLAGDKLRNGGKDARDTGIEDLYCHEPGDPFCSYSDCTVPDYTYCCPDLRRKDIRTQRRSIELYHYISPCRWIFRHIQWPCNLAEKGGTACCHGKYDDVAVDVLLVCNGAKEFYAGVDTDHHKGESYRLCGRVHQGVLRKRCFIGGDLYRVCLFVPVCPGVCFLGNGDVCQSE